MNLVNLVAYHTSVQFDYEIVNSLPLTKCKLIFEIVISNLCMNTFMIKMDECTEIRKLTPSHVKELSKTLDYGESWKRVMSMIPNTLYKDNYQCDLTRNNLPKYHSEHFKLIESASMHLRRSCTEILLDEWGTSGRIRPTLGHLLHLLIKAELFKAADYVAIKLLNKQAPQRPAIGPAAKVITTLPELDAGYKNGKEVNVHHQASIITQQNLIDNNKASKKRSVKLVIPKLVINECLDIKTNFHQSVVNTKQVSDMIKFSEPEVSDMMTFSSESSYNLNDIPDIDALLTDSSKTNNKSIDSNIGKVTEEKSFDADDANIPELSVLNVKESSNVLNVYDTSEDLKVDDSSNNIPNLSILMGTRNASLSNLHITTSQDMETKSDSNETSLPLVFTSIESERVVDNIAQNENTPNTLKTKDGSDTRQNCHSPLPNLSLNTLLPHFSYSQIEIATNNFDTTRHLTVLDMEEESLAEQKNGRFLGSGAFGSVYLALDLIDKPVAVKKLFLQDVSVVNVDDTVTKQFKTEVEILCKYKHINLLSLIGYSCDGPTYCLLYEYISGGALNERLQKNKELLTWKDRLNIASGIANAVAYLHTAFDVPLIHRDIKSANILLDCAKKPKLCDFGLIKLTPNQNTLTGTSVFGTSAYMAPEAFRGDISVKLDTFSFGVVLLELVTGLSPLDDHRDGNDIVTHVGTICEDDAIEPLLDKSSGKWIENETNFGQLLFEISLECLADKKKRPTMVIVCAMMEDLLKKLL